MLRIRRSRDGLILPWESPYLGKMVFIFRRGPGLRDGTWTWSSLYLLMAQHGARPSADTMLMATLDTFIFNLLSQSMTLHRFCCLDDVLQYGRQDIEKYRATSSVKTGMTRVSRSGCDYVCILDYRYPRPAADRPRGLQWRARQAGAFPAALATTSGLACTIT